MKDLAMAVDWANIITQVLLLIASGVLVPFLVRWLKLNNDDKTREYLSTAIEGAIRAGVSTYAKEKGATPAAVLLSVANDHAVRDNITGFAVEYLKHNTPGALRKLGVNGGLSDIIVSRLDDVSRQLSGTIAATAHNLQAVQESRVPVEKTAATQGALGAPITVLENPQGELPVG